MKQLYLGAQLYSLRNYTKTAEDFRETMRKCRDIGYKYVQVSGVGAEVTPEVIKAAIDETGIQVTLTHYSKLDDIINNTEKVIEIHESFGCDYIGVGGMGDHTEEGYKKFAADIAPAVEKIKAAGKTFLYHNHHKEFVKYGDKYGLDIICENTDPEGVKLTLDTYWATYAGEDAAAIINRYGKRIAVTHFKDMQIRNGERTMTEMLTGIIDYDPIMKAVADNDIIWNFIEQDTIYIDEFESMKISHDNMKARYNMI